MTRRCAWSYGINCHDPATQVVLAEFHGVPIDHDLLFCDAHAGEIDELIRPGWTIAAITPLTADTVIRRKPRAPKPKEIPA